MLNKVLSYGKYLNYILKNLKRSSLPNIFSSYLIMRSKNMPMKKKCIPEFMGTFWLVLGECTSAVFAASFLPKRMF